MRIGYSRCLERSNLQHFLASPLKAALFLADLDFVGSDVKGRAGGGVAR